MVCDKTSSYTVRFPGTDSEQQTHLDAPEPWQGTP